jgi:preprotein translocase subunit SecD
MITAFILYTFAASPLIKGFALVFFIGVAISMFTSITVSKNLLLAISKKNK